MKKLSFFLGTVFLIGIFLYFWPSKKIEPIALPVAVKKNEDEIFFQKTEREKPVFAADPMPDFPDILASGDLAPAADFSASGKVFFVRDRHKNLFLRFSDFSVSPLKNLQIFFIDPLGNRVFFQNLSAHRGAKNFRLDNHFNLLKFRKIEIFSPPLDQKIATAELF